MDLCNGSDCRHGATCIPLYDSLSYRCYCSPGQSQTQLTILSIPKYIIIVIIAVFKVLCSFKNV